jgi:hypothetical protein
MTIKQKLKQLIEEQKQKSFVSPKQITDEEVLGLLISQYLEWNGKKIFDTSYFAFEDSNFHKKHLESLRCCIELIEEDIPYLNPNY